MRSWPAIAVFLAIISQAVAQSGDPSGLAQLPPFLAPYYADAIAGIAKDMSLKEESTKDNTSRYVYMTADQVASLEFQSFTCERDRCQVLYNNAVTYTNNVLTQNAGRFLKATPTEFTAAWQTGYADNDLLVAKLPASLLFVTYSARLDRHVDIKSFSSQMMAAIDRQRYETVQSLDQVQKGLWSKAAADYAGELLKAGKKDQAGDVLRNTVASAPFDYRAQIELAELTHEPALANNSALAVYDNSESPDLVARAAQILGRQVSKISDLPAVEFDDDSHLHVVLVALPPCDIRLLSDAAAVYRKITGIRTIVVRLPMGWQFDSSDRIPDQRRIQQIIIQKRGPGVNFSGWKRERYETELLNTVTASDALTKFSTEEFVEKLDARADQYDARPYLNRLADDLSQNHGSGLHAIYVGVTEADIFLGDTNYVFSGSVTRNGISASIVSYNRMMAKSAGDRFESRRRLTERLAKQLVPPTLSALGITRPVDPTDPYSYADGIQRVDEKSLSLSQSTKDALDKLR